MTDNLREKAEKHTETCPGIEDGLHAAVDGLHKDVPPQGAKEAKL